MYVHIIYAFPPIIHTEINFMHDHFHFIIEYNIAC